MNLIKTEYIKIDWMRKRLIDMLYNGDIDHEVLEVFLKLIGEWLKENVGDKNS